MSKDYAIEILKAHACCSLAKLTCEECPLWEEKPTRCNPWTEKEVAEAVRLLNENGENLNIIKSNENWHESGVDNA